MSVRRFSGNLLALMLLCLKWLVKFSANKKKSTSWFFFCFFCLTSVLWEMTMWLLGGGSRKCHFTIVCFSKDRGRWHWSLPCYNCLWLHKEDTVSSSEWGIPEISMGWIWELEGEPICLISSFVLMCNNSGWLLHFGQWFKVAIIIIIFNFLVIVLDKRAGAWASWHWGAGRAKGWDERERIGLGSSIVEDHAVPSVVVWSKGALSIQSCSMLIEACGPLQIVSCKSGEIASR